MRRPDRIRWGQGEKMSIHCGLGAVLWLVLPVVALGGSSAPGPDPEASIERGRALYEVYCQGCHGVEADGRGPMAESLAMRPPDLTRLRTGEDEAFPVERIHRAIDGRESRPGHLRRDMPIWGLTFQELGRDWNQEDEVRAKIRSILDYLETIQRPVEGK